MLKNVYLFIGEESYLLNKELKRWEENFLSKFGADSFFAIDIETIEAQQLKEIVFSWGLFVSQKLIVIRELPLSSARIAKGLSAKIDSFSDTFIQSDAIIPPTHIVVFVSGKPDKRTRFFKFLKDKATVKEFNPLRESELKLFISKELEWFIYNNDFVDAFLLKVGGKLMRVSSELNKLKLYAESQNIKNLNLDLLEKVVFWDVQADSFQFYDLLFSNKNKTFEFVDKMQHQWNDWNAFLGLLWWGSKLYLILQNYLERWISDSKKIAEETKYHPFVLKNAMKYSNLLKQKWQKIWDFYSSLVELEYGLKNGFIYDKSFWLEIKKIVDKFYQV